MILRSADGTLIFCESLLVPRARGNLLVVHGLGEYSGRYHELAAQAQALNLNVHLFDLRGHGRSQGTRGHFSDLEEHHRDMDAWIEHLVGAGDLRIGKPCFLLGHSLGGLIALTYCAQYVAGPMRPEITGMILSSPALGILQNPLRMVETGVAKHLPRFLQNVQVPSGIKAKDLTHDRDEVRRYEEDPLVHGWCTPSAYLAIQAGMAKIYDLLPKLDLPVLFLVSGKDKVVDSAAAQKFAKKLSVAHHEQVELKVFQRFFHEAFHELGKERAFLELKKWILKQLLPLSKRNSSASSVRGATGKATSL
ncbi:MAG: alpha/beta hydrolase [Bdellovibrionota bacterium]